MKLGRAALLAATVLVACTTAGQVSYRDPSRQIASSALLDPSLFAGTWNVVAAYGPEAACGNLVEVWTQSPSGYDVAFDRCIVGRTTKSNGRATFVGPGRLALSATRKSETIWVLWIDADYRVAVVGTPDGSFGRIMSRDTAIRSDLLQAARKILQFNGYDLAGLKML